MDASPDVLAETVRAKRVAVDNDLELLRVRLQRVDPRRLDAQQWARIAVPMVAVVALFWGFSSWRRARRFKRLAAEMRQLSLR